MNTPRSLFISIGITAGLILSGMLVNIFFVVSKIHMLRTNIDNNRASIALAHQQQSNLNKLGRDLDSIKEKQVELEKQEWKFINEDQFYQLLEKLSETKNLTVDAPNISDATPDGSLITRTVGINMRGPLSTSLDAIAKIQNSIPLIALQHLTITSGPTAGTVNVAIDAVTLWQ